MRDYEAMFILKPDLQEEQIKAAALELEENIKKNQGEIVTSQKWSERKTLSYQLRVRATGGYAKYDEGIYYLIVFKSNTQAISKLNSIFKLNNNILRVLVTSKAK